MFALSAFTPARLRRAALVVLAASSLAGCGGGGEVVVGPPAVAPLDLALTRVGPLAVQVDWSDYPPVQSFGVYRNGYLLASVNATTLIDNSVMLNQTYCYEVDGYDASGVLIAATSRGCITIVP